MINQGKNVPEKTIAAVPFSNKEHPITQEFIDSYIEKPGKKRTWFGPEFYNCLPLTVGNQYGFIIKAGFNFAFTWNGGNDPSDLSISTEYPPEVVKDMWPAIGTHFGHGILTVNLPFTLRTPPNVNLININQPNIITPNLTTMTGVVEADNLRRDFSINLKVTIPDILVNVYKDAPLAAVLPIPRYFGDAFTVIPGSDLFDEETIQEEIQAAQDAYEYRRTTEKTLPNQIGKHYMKGMDVYGNPFPDHQRG